MKTRALRHDQAAADVSRRVQRSGRSTSSTAPPLPPNDVRNDAAAAARRRGRGQGRAHSRYALEHAGAIVAELERYFGIAVSVREAGLDRGARLRRGRDGERGRDHVPRDALARSIRRPRREWQRRRYANVTAHEIAHQWFGDLVTMRVVGRHLAERGVRDVDGDTTSSPRCFRSSARREVQLNVGARRDGSGQPRRRAQDPPADRDHARHRQRLRRHHVSKGRRRARACSSATSVRRCFAAACSTTCASTRTATPAPTTCSLRSARPRAKT